MHVSRALLFPLLLAASTLAAQDASRPPAHQTAGQAAGQAAEKPAGQVAEKPAEPPVAQLPVLTGDPAPNSKHAQKQHYVVLVSLDAFRFDYVSKWSATHLAQLAAAGATAPAGMLPSYPSLTFPNHLTLITGLLPEHTGIVGNHFYDPARGAEYSYRSTETNADGTWYHGVPLWSLAEAQGMRAASCFWPGSEAAIAGHRPAFYLHFNDRFEDARRIDQVIAWLALPPAERPHLITLYYSNVDHAGHDHGPDSPEVQAAVHHVDELMGELRARLDRTGLPVDLVVVADHGMSKVEGSFITLDQFADLSHFKTDGALLYAEGPTPEAREAVAARAYDQFRAHPDSRFIAYRRAELPPSLQFSENPRAGDPIVVATGPYAIRAHEAGNTHLSVGEHGYDPARVPAMKALFVANGPDIRPGTVLPTFPNPDVYSFVAHLLALKPGPTDGTLSPLKPALKH